MSDNLPETKSHEEQDHSHDSGWLSRLNDLQKILAAIAAIVVSLGALGTAAYVARDSWEKALGLPPNGPATPTPSLASPTLRTFPPGGTHPICPPARPPHRRPGPVLPALRVPPCRPERLPRHHASRTSLALAI